MIYSQRFPRDDYDELAAIHHDEMTAEERAASEAEGAAAFQEFMELYNNRVFVENPERMSKSKEFVSLAIEFSETWSVDMDIEEKDGHISVHVHMDCSTYPGEMKDMLAKLIAMSDKMCSFILPNEPSDFTLILDYYTHDVYFNGKLESEI